MSKIRIFLTSFFLLFSFQTFSQNVNYARQIIDTLTSSELAGRGYVDDGDLKAAGLIAGEMKQLGLSSYSFDYVQKFTIPVNSHPGILSLNINDEELVPGVDYILHPCSPSQKGSFKTSRVDLNNTFEPNSLRFKKGYLVVDVETPSAAGKGSAVNLKHQLSTFRNNDQSFEGIIQLTEEKLTWHTSTSVCKIPHFIVSKTSVPEKIKKVKVDIENKFFENYNTQNVIGYISGKTYPDSILVLGAHYDHIGKMGSNTIFWGANDNASGTAFLLNLAKHFSAPENQPEYTIVFIAFAAEEMGLLGSSYFVKNSPFPLENVKFMLNFDMVGTGEEGITVVNGATLTNFFTLFEEINLEKGLLPQIKKRGEACNSDHCPFYNRGVPSFFIYTMGGSKAYHDVNDKASAISLYEFEDLTTLVIDFLNKLQVVREFKE